MIEVEKMEKLSETWSELSPNEAAENTSEASVSCIKEYKSYRIGEGVMIRHYPNIRSSIDV